jgi:hypothetical protein
MAKSRLSMAIRDTKRQIKTLNSDIEYLKTHAEKIKSGEVTLSRHWEKDSQFARETESESFLKSNDYRGAIAKRTQAKKQLEKLERIKEMRKKRK